MLSDRFYMRDPNTEQKTSVLTWLVAAIISAFVLEVVFSGLFRNSPETLRNIEVTIPGLRQGKIWTLFTYGFVHWNSARNLLHVVGVLAGLVIFGRELLPSLGPRRFIGLYAGALILGGLTWAAANWSQSQAELFGGMAGVYGLMIVFACLNPEQDFNFTVFFFPVTIKPRHLAIGLAVMEFSAFVFYEVYGATRAFPYAPSAHLGGMAAGLIYYRFIHTARWPSSAPALVDVEPPRWIKKNPTLSSALDPVRIAPATRDELRAEVDRILDKINSAGLSALTPSEKRLLDDAKDQLTRG